MFLMKKYVNVQVFNGFDYVKLPQCCKLQYKTIFFSWNQLFRSETFSGWQRLPQPGPRGQSAWKLFRGWPGWRQLRLASRIWLKFLEGFIDLLSRTPSLARRDTEGNNTFNVEDYNNGLGRYKKYIKGIDNWTATELRKRASPSRPASWIAILGLTCMGSA